MIEFLVVIAIIGILAAITIPVVGVVRQRARAAQCMSNQRQVAQALLLYAGERPGKLPPLANANTGDGSWWTNRLVDGGFLPDGKWGSRAYGQMHSGVFLCPLVTEPSWFGGIAYSGAVANFNRAATVVSIRNPSRVALLADAPINVNADGKISATPNIVRLNPGQNVWSGERRVNRHSGGGYVAFVDGHIEHWLEVDLINNKDGILDPVY